MPTGHAYPEYLTKDSLDPPHEAVIEFVRAYRKKHEWGPSVHDIATGIGRPVASATHMVARLIRSGYLVRPGNPRTHTRTLRLAEGGERSDALMQGWLVKLRELPLEEKHAAVAAAEKIGHEMRAAAGEPGAGPS